MRVDVEFLEKGTIAVCDLAGLDPRPKHSDDLYDRAGYEPLARAGRLFFFEPLDAIAGGVSIFVDEPVPSALEARVYGSVRGRLLRAPSGDVVVCPVDRFAEDVAAEDIANATRVRLPPGDYRVDAHVLAPTDEEVAGPKPKGPAGCFQSFLVLSIPWFLFCTICYGMLAHDGLWREALPIYAVIGGVPVALAIVLFYVSGARRRVAEASAVYDALPKTPSLVVVLTPKGDDADVTEGGGIVQDDYAEQLSVIGANW